MVFKKIYGLIPPLLHKVELNDSKRTFVTREDNMNVNAAFQWERQPQAEALILDILARALKESQIIAQLSEDLYNQTNTRLFDWLDFVAIRRSDNILHELKTCGFVHQKGDNPDLFIHPGAQLPRILLLSSRDLNVGLGLGVDSISDFLMVRGMDRVIEGALFGNFRRCQFSLENGIVLWVIERRGVRSLQPTQESPEEISRYFLALEKWKCRCRSLEEEDRAMDETLQITAQLVDEIGQDRAAWTVLEGERRYWQSRNTAGQIQKNRQDRLGMGWANHDHHTFRSSRKRFKKLVSLFELLGFHCRERFYAGEEAGWGAQIMENPVCRLILFLDVDLAPTEIAEDFAHEPLPELEKLGTIGLWCALHGDSILRGGMHHLEAQFMFEELGQGLASRGINMMSPFSSFPYLKQAFTVGENWKVDPNRVHLLVQQGKITPQQGDHFLSNGAIGSHLENLQRREGYKGFNQKNVSIIIKKTDPRLKN